MKLKAEVDKSRPRPTRGATIVAAALNAIPDFFFSEGLSFLSLNFWRFSVLTTRERERQSERQESATEVTEMLCTLEAEQGEDSKLPY